MIQDAFTEVVNEGDLSLEEAAVVEEKGLLGIRLTRDFRIDEVLPIDIEELMKNDPERLMRLKEHTARIRRGLSQ